MDTQKTKAISLVQPNKVTNARHDYSEREQNILTLMIDAIQKHMSRETPIQTDLFNQPMVTIDTKDVGANNKQQYWESAKAMKKKDFEFEYTNPDGKQEEVSGVLVTTVRNVRESSLIHITINTWAIPYLLFWGKGVGGTVFNKTIALTLKGEYTKRLYALCKRWEDKGGFSMSLDDFRNMMCLENKYPELKDLKKRVLDSAKERMQDGADVYFNYALDKVGGSKSYNQLHFTVHGNNKNRPKSEKTELYTFVYNMLCLAWPNYTDSRAKDLCDKLAQNPRDLESLYQRLKQLKNQMDVGDKDPKDVSNLIKYIIKNDYTK